MLSRYIRSLGLVCAASALSLRAAPPVASVVARREAL